MIDINIIRSDFLAYISCKMFQYINNIEKITSTIFTKIKMRIGGVIYGKGFQSRGKILIYKCPGSRIDIGDNCVFNNNSRYNFRGINHPSILQTGTSIS